MSIGSVTGVFLGATGHLGLRAAILSSFEFEDVHFLVRHAGLTHSADV